MTMAVQTIRIAGKEYVLLPKKEYLKLKPEGKAEARKLTEQKRKRLIAEAQRLGRKLYGKASSAAELARNEDEDLALLVQALRVMADPEQSKTVPYEQVRKHLGLV